MLHVFTNHTKNSLSSDNFAKRTDFRNRCSYFHIVIFKIRAYFLLLGTGCPHCNFCLYVILPFERSYGLSSIVTVSPSISLMKLRFIWPQRYPLTIFHQKSAGNCTSKTRPGRVFTIFHSTSILSSFLDIEVSTFSKKLA